MDADRKSLRQLLAANEAGPMFFSLNTVQSLRGCSDFELAVVGQLRLPMLYNVANDRFEVVEWARCFNLIAEALGGSRIASERGPRRLAFVSGVDQLPSPHWRSESQNGEDQDDSRPVDTLVHFVSRFSKRHLELGRTTLLLPCLQPDPHWRSRQAIAPIDTFRADNGGWQLPVEVIEWEVESRRLVKDYRVRACRRL
ncbi:hypothetical protein ACCS54_03790 [Rhizobium johnstonii]|jgi:hypothetical protein|uniref:hypothetical protein n=1 Tax=Rhizobium TaxID=379 RepID=UPI00140FEB2E|nr:hypothetical protein [Rhizobium leguminosarum]QIO63994.1 hypothetical protein HA462_02530 [Rhizobium leguminosarum bv. trifolii]